MLVDNQEIIWNYMIYINKNQNNWVWSIIKAKGDIFALRMMQTFL